MTDLSVADFFLQCIMLGCCIAAVILMGIAQRDYKPLRFWFFGTIFLTIGETFSVIAVLQPSLIYVEDLCYVAAVITLFTYSVREYKSLKSEIQHGIIITPVLGKGTFFLPFILLDTSLLTLLNPVILLSIVLNSLVAASAILCYLIFRIKRTPTHFIMTLALIWIFVAECSVIIKYFDAWSFMVIISDGISILFTVLVLMIAIVAKIEMAMVHNQERIQQVADNLGQIIQTNRADLRSINIFSRRLIFQC